MLDELPSYIPTKDGELPSDIRTKDGELPSNIRTKDGEREYVLFWEGERLIEVWREVVSLGVLTSNITPGEMFNVGNKKDFQSVER